MARFTFTALRQGGGKYSGELEAESKHAVVEHLRSEGSTALSVELARAHGAHKLSLHITLFGGNAKMSEKILFARNLSAMVGAGLSLSRALAVLQKQTRDASMKKIIEEVDETVRQGQPLSAALSAHPKSFPPLFIAMVRSGEESGKLSQALMTIAVQMERSYALTKKVRGAMFYPAIVFTVMLGIGVLMLVYVVPTLAATFASLNTALPLPTRLVIDASNFVVQDGFLLLILVVFAIAALIFAARQPAVKRAIHTATLHFPLVGPIVARVNAARTARTLSSLLASGVAALSALQITGEVVQNARFREVIDDARGRVEKGKPLSEAFVEAEHIYPVMFSEMTAVGEETGDLSGMLERVADFYESEVEQETKDLSTIIEPLLMVFIGGGVGFFAIAMIAPIYSLSSAL